MDFETLQRELYKIYLSSPTNLFDEFVNVAKAWYEQPAHSFGEMRRRENKKLRGDIFEMFCVLYLRNRYINSYLLKDIHVDLLNRLGIRSRDMGIDLIVEDNGKFYAVQCKYKTPNNRDNIVSWKSLSTFYALCLRSGPWDKYIVMTNCTCARHEGRKTDKDLSICLGTFRNITSDEWLKMCGLQGNVLNSIVEPIKNDINKIREARLARFG